MSIPVFFSGGGGDSVRPRLHLLVSGNAGDWGRLLDRWTRVLWSASFRDVGGGGGRGL